MWEITNLDVSMFGRGCGPCRIDEDEDEEEDENEENKVKVDTKHSQPSRSESIVMRMPMPNNQVANPTLGPGSEKCISLAQYTVQYPGTVQYARHNQKQKRCRRNKIRRVQYGSMRCTKGGIWNNTVTQSSTHKRQRCV